MNKEPERLDVVIVRDMPLDSLLVFRPALPPDTDGVLRLPWVVARCWSQQVVDPLFDAPQCASCYQVKHPPLQG